ncbi:MAG TPA: hypothetical protein VIM79_08965 [Niastella sp.]
MKKIENWLFWPVLFIVFANYLLEGESKLGIDKKSVSIITPSMFSGISLVILVVLFFLYKIIRKRNGAVNKPWAISHVAITTLLIVIIWYLVQNQQMPRRYFSTSFKDELSIWVIHNQALVKSVFVFLLVQVSFLIVFIVQIMKKPA